jgi:transposase-like protein
LRESIYSHIAKLDPPRYTVSQVAEQVGKHPDTLTAWRRKGIFIPTGGQYQMGQLSIWLYTPKDVEELKVLIERRRPGPRRTRHIKVDAEWLQDKGVRGRCAR